MADTNNSSSSGIGFCGLLTIVLITLKLLGYITCSWWWVTAPMWIGLAFVGVILVFVFLITLIAACLK